MKALVNNNNKHFLPKVHTVICNAHFKRKDYAIDDGYMKLYQCAIPSIYGYIGNTKREAILENNIKPDIIISNVVGNFKGELKLQPQNDIDFIVDDSTGSIDVHLDKTANENQSNMYTNNTKMLMTTNTTKPNVSPKSPSLWVNRRGEYKYNIPNKFLQKLKILTRKNERLISKNRCLMKRNQQMEDIQIKYLELKNKVLETEEKLLMNGIDTSEYSAFQITYDEPEPQQNDNQMDDGILLECSLDKIKPIPINNNSKPHFSSECSPTIEIILSSDDDFEIIE